MKAAITVTIGIILDQPKITSIAQVLLAKRQAHQSHAGCWEFPGGKAEPGETALETLKRELAEEVNIQVQQAEFYARNTDKVQYTQFALEFFLVTRFVGEPQGHEGQLVQWWPLHALTTLSVPKANIPVIAQLQAAVS